MVTLTDLLEEHAAIALEKQYALADLIGELDWFADLDTGTLKFGDRHEFPIQVLGTESVYDNTWLWAWANVQSDIPAGLLARANQLRDLGEKEGIAAFTEAKLSLDEVNGTTVALIASGLFKTAGYYRGPHEGGAAFMLLEAPPLESQAERDLLEIATVFLELTAVLEINHRRAFTAYARQRGLTLQPTEAGLTASATGRQALKLDFDAEDRLVNLETMLLP